MDPDALLQKLEQEIAAAGSPTIERRIRSWEMRVKGYLPTEICKQLGVSLQQTYHDIRWCQDNLPSAIEGREAFKKLALTRLEEQYRLLESGRAAGDDGAIRASQNVIDIEAKLFGAYAPQRVDPVQVNYTVTGVDTQDLS